MMIPTTGAGIMGTIRKTVTVTDQQDQWIKAQIEAGRFTNDSEYLRDLIRRDQETSRSNVLKQAVEEGLASGPSGRTVPQIMRDVEARLKKNGAL
jgi:antitoxin ParD1/3/4